MLIRCLKEWLASFFEQAEEPPGEPPWAVWFQDRDGAIIDYWLFRQKDHAEEKYQQLMFSVGKEQVLYLGSSKRVKQAKLAE